MQHLQTHFDTWNVASYPPCIIGLIGTHKALCLRRKLKINQKKIILALSWEQALPQFHKRINASAIDQHYDHVIYQNKNSLQQILNASTKDFLLETYKYRDKNKKEIIANAPPGKQVKIPVEFSELCQQSISMWFYVDEVFWLEEQHDA